MEFCIFDTGAKGEEGVLGAFACMETIVVAFEEVFLVD